MGLDPAIQQCRTLSGFGVAVASLDRRVEPGDDNKEEVRHCRQPP